MTVVMQERCGFICCVGLGLLHVLRVKAVQSFTDTLPIVETEFNMCIPASAINKHVKKCVCPRHMHADHLDFVKTLFCLQFCEFGGLHKHFQNGEVFVT